jgi:hypothetical protein
MKTFKNAKGMALAVAGLVLAAGTAVVNIPALANTGKGKTTTNKGVKVKTTVKSGTTTPPQPPTFGDNDGDGPRGHGGFGGPDGAGAQALKDVLADLVTKGTITQEQSDAITSALDAKRTAAQKAESDFRTQADAIIAGVLGITVDELNTQRANHTLQVTDAQRQTIKTKLDALRTSLGLPTGGFGRGDGDGDGPGMGAPGAGGPGAGGPGMGMRSHHGGRF